MRRVLVLDDSLTVRMDLREALEDAGFFPRTCATLEEARRVLTDETIHAVVLDVLLPDGSGVDLLQELRSDVATADMVVLLLSTEAEVSDRMRGMRSGADEYVGKPYDRRYVVGRLQELLRLQQVVEEGATTVLVVDDSPTFRHAMSAACESAGYRVVTARDGEEGLRYVSSERPDAVVVDGVLPDIGGETVIRRIRLDPGLRRVPCLLITSDDDVETELRAFDAGADGFVRKGEDTAVVLARLATLVRNRPAVAGVDDQRSLLGPKRILTVDDSITVAEHTAQQLRDAGYDVVVATSGMQALDLLSVQSVDCVLLDLLMPGLDGYETCQRLRRVPALQDIPVVMLTSVEDEESVIHALAAGADDYVHKTSEPQVLLARVRAQLRRKHIEDEHRRLRDQLVQQRIQEVRARAANELAAARAALIEELERKNEELEAFSYSVSHDLRAPLRAIRGFAEALDEDHADQLDAEGRSHLHRVLAATHRMYELIDDLIDLSRVSSADLCRQPVDMGELFTEVAAQLDAEIAVEVDGVDDPVVHADPGLMRVVMENLVSNAVKFTRGIPDPAVHFTVRQQDGQRVYVLQDNGAGFDPDHAASLFRPFHRLHHEAEFPGTGVGLATVRRVVERHGGRVHAHSEGPGRGAEFSFTLPEGPRLGPADWKELP